MDDLPFRELVDAAPDGLVVCDQEGKILLVNAEALRMFGYAREELLGQSVDCLVPASIRPRHRGVLQHGGFGPRRYRRVRRLTAITPAGSRKICVAQPRAAIAAHIGAPTS